MKKNNQIRTEFSKFFSILLALLIYLWVLPLGTAAHDIIPGSWLFVDGTAAIDYNPSLTNSTLPVAERVLKKPLEVNQEYEFSINYPAFAEKFKVKQDQIKANWILEGKTIASSQSHTFRFTKQGNYFLEVTILNTASPKEKVIFTDTLLMQVGKTPEVFAKLRLNAIGPNFTAENISATGKSVSFPLDEGEVESFGLDIANLNEDVFDVTWDLNGKVSTDLEPTFLMDYYTRNNYVLARVTHKESRIFQDYHLTINNPLSPSQNSINRPAAIRDTTATENMEDKQPLPYQLLFGAGLLLFSAVGLFFSLLSKQGKN